MIFGRRLSLVCFLALPAQVCLATDAPKSAKEEMGQVAREILVFLEPSPVLVPTLKHLLGALIETAPALQSPQE